MLIMLLVASCGGGKKSQEGINFITFDPNPAFLSSGICTAKVKLIGDSSQDVTLLGAQITLIDGNDPEISVSYTDIDIADVFERIFVTMNGFVEGELSIDGPARGINGPFDAYFIVFGSAVNGYSRNFLGYLECNE